MSARMLYWLFTIVWILAAIATLVALAFVIVAPLIDQTLVTSFTLANELEEYSLPIDAELGPEAVLTIDQGQLTIVIPGVWAGLLRAFDVVITGGVWICLTWIMRRFFRKVDTDRPFSRQSTGELLLGGVLLVTFPVWQLIVSIVWQTLLMNMISPNTGITTTLGAAGSGIQWRVLPEVDPIFALAGLVLLVMAKAFRLGVAIQQDNDEIV